MKIYSIEDKNTGALKSSYCSTSWVDRTKDDGFHVYSIQGYEAADPRYKASINTQVKILLAQIKRYIAYPFSIQSPSPFLNIVKDCKKYCNSHGINPKSWDKNEFFALEIMRKHIRIKIIDLFTGAISYEDIKPFLSKKLQKELK